MAFVPVTPVWQAATVGSPAQSGQINQFLGGHTSTILFQSNSRAASSSATGTYTTTVNQYLGQPFLTTSTQTTVGYVELNLIDSNPGSPTYSLPLTVSLYADSGSSSPVLTTTDASGNTVSAALSSVTLTREYVFQSAQPLRFPLPATGLTPSTKYWLVTAPGPNDGVNYRWAQASTTSGGVGYISSTGATWTAQSYGFSYTVYDQVPLSTPGAGSSWVATWEDYGAHWKVAYRFTTLPTNNSISAIYEYTAGQQAMGYVQSLQNNLTYTNGVLAGLH